MPTESLRIERTCAISIARSQSREAVAGKDRQLDANVQAAQRALPDLGATHTTLNPTDPRPCFLRREDRSRKNVQRCCC